jgi:hypothetical protein
LLASHPSQPSCCSRAKHARLIVGDDSESRYACSRPRCYIKMASAAQGAVYRSLMVTSTSTPGSMLQAGHKDQCQSTAWLSHSQLPLGNWTPAGERQLSWGHHIHAALYAMHSPVTLRTPMTANKTCWHAASTLQLLVQQQGCACSPDGGDLLHHIGGGVQVDQALVDPASRQRDACQLHACTRGQRLACRHSTRFALACRHSTGCGRHTVLPTQHRGASIDV